MPIINFGDWGSKLIDFLVLYENVNDSLQWCSDRDSYHMINFYMNCSYTWDHICACCGIKVLPKLRQIAATLWCTNKSLKPALRADHVQFFPYMLKTTAFLLRGWKKWLLIHDVLIQDGQTVTQFRVVRYGSLIVRKIAEGIGKTKDQWTKANSTWYVIIHGLHPHPHC